MIDRKTLEDRLAQMKQEREQAVAQVNALAGAIADCEYWLKIVDQPPAVAEAGKAKPASP